MNKQFYLTFLLISVTLTSFVKPEKQIRSDFKKFYDEYKVEGSFVLYDQKHHRSIVYNQQQTDIRFTPASTFKIYNSLVALEEGIVDNENIIFKWDGQKRQVPAWNADTDMKAAFKNSTVWFYQELARRTGRQRMKFWLDKGKYGNADTTGGIDAFWLSGNLRITPNEQIKLLQKLHDNKLPFSKRTIEIVKRIMITKDTTDYVVRSKTGLSKQDAQYIGWNVGYITTNDNIYYFSNCIQSRARNPDFAIARIDITNKIIEELQLIKQ